MAFQIILIGLWTYPLISLLLFLFTKNKVQLRKKVIATSVVLTFLALIGLFINISTTLSWLDWILISTIYLTISLVLMWTQFQQRKILKIIGAISMFIVFGLGYLSGTIGALGVGFIINEYETKYEKWLGNGIIYKERLLGNAVSDERGKKAELYRTISWLPIIEWRIQTETYTTYLRCVSTPTEINYQPQEKKVYLSGSMWSEYDKKYINWNDTIDVEKDRN